MKLRIIANSGHLYPIGTIVDGHCFAEGNDFICVDSRGIQQMVSQKDVEQVKQIEQYFDGSMNDCTIKTDRAKDFDRTIVAIDTAIARYEKLISVKDVIEEM